MAIRYSTHLFNLTCILFDFVEGIKGVFEYGEQHGKSNRDDWLVQVPNAAMVFAENNYTTFHSGKL